MPPAPLLESQHALMGRAKCWEPKSPGLELQPSHLTAGEAWTRGRASVSLFVECKYSDLDGRVILRVKGNNDSNVLSITPGTHTVRSPQGLPVWSYPPLLQTFQRLPNSSPWPAGPAGRVQPPTRPRTPPLTTLWEAFVSLRPAMLFPPGGFAQALPQVCDACAPFVGVWLLREP